MTDNTQQVVSFGDFGRSYQEKVVQAILGSNDFAQQIIEVLDVNYFEQKYLQVLAEAYFSYYKKYNTFPSMNILATILSNELTEGDKLILKKQIKDYLIKIKQEPLNGDERYVKDSALEFCKKQSLKSALLKSVEMIQQAKYDQIVSLIKGAIELGTPKDYGQDYVNEIELRHSAAEKRNTVATGWEVLDRKNVLNGGLARGELGTIIGSAGAGKSNFLVHLGANALKRGYNVLHYTLELSENCIGIRYDACLTGVSQNDTNELKDAITKFMPTLPNATLYIKSFPTKSASIQTLKNHMHTLDVKNFKPDLIIVDYGDIMRSVKGYEAKRFELESIYEDLRGMAQELNVAIWTAAQSSRGGVNAEIIDMDLMGESFAKVQIADIVLTFSRTREDKATKGGRVYIAKNRIGQDGMVFNAKLDTATVSIHLSEQDDDVDIFTPEREEQRTKQSLQKKWEELKRESN